MSPAAALRKCVSSAGGSHEAGPELPGIVAPNLRQVSRTVYPLDGDSAALITYVDSQGGHVGALSLQAGSTRMGDVIQYNASNTLNRTLLGGKDVAKFDYAEHCGRHREAVREVVEAAVSRFIELGVMPSEALVDARKHLIEAWSALFAKLDSRGASDLLGPARTTLINLFWRCLDTAFMRATAKGWLLRRSDGKLDPQEYSLVETAFNLVLLPDGVLFELPAFASLKRKLEGQSSRGESSGGGRNGGRGRAGGRRAGRGGRSSHTGGRSGDNDAHGTPAPTA